MGSAYPLPLKVRPASVGLALLLGCLFVEYPGAAHYSPDGSAMPSTEQANGVFGAWTNRCIRAPEAGTTPMCEVVTSIRARAQAQDQLTLNVQIAVGQSNQPGWTRIAIGVPSDVLLSTPIRLTRENVVIPPLVYDRCGGGWCTAITDIEEGAFQLLINATGDGRVQYQTSTGQDFIVPVSFLGFQDAVAAMRSVQPPR